jgi:hypothetical protein
MHGSTLARYRSHSLVFSLGHPAAPGPVLIFSRAEVGAGSSSSTIQLLGRNPIFTRAWTDWPKYRSCLGRVLGEDGDGAVEVRNGIRVDQAIHVLGFPFAR